MNAIERWLVWFGGYSPQTVAGSQQEDIEQIIKIGSAVLFAAMVALINWGIAGWTFSEGISTDIRSAILIASALFGFCMAALFDRSFVYFADTAMTRGGFKLIVFGAARVAIIIAIGSITSQTIIPLVLKSELQAHALQMAEISEKTRVAELNERFRVEDLEDTVNSAISNVEKLRLAANTIPPDIQQRINAANQSWAELNDKRTELINGGLSASDADEKLKAKALFCKNKIRAANAERNTYLAQTRAQLNQAIERKQFGETQMAETKITIKAKVERAAQVEAESFNPRSSAVLWSLLSTNPGARWKWALISFIQLVCELVPLILKFQAGQSNIGRRIAKNRAVSRMDIDEHLKDRENSFAVSSAIHATSMKAVEDALKNPDVRAIFTQSFAAYLAAFAPTEAVRTMMREFEARHVDVEEFVHRFPRYASVISQAWSKAIKDTAEILNHGLRVDPAQGVGGSPWI